MRGRGRGPVLVSISARWLRPRWRCGGQQRWNVSNLVRVALCSLTDWMVFMRSVVSLICEVAGIICVVIAAWMIAVPLGLFAAGVCALLFGLYLELGD